MLECVVIAKDLACRGRMNAATIENDAWCVEKQGVFSVIRDGDLDIYKILGMELEKWRKGISSELTRARRERKRCSLMVKDIYCAVPTCRTGRSSMKRDGCPMI